MPLKSEGCNESQGFRGNCDSQGKLGMCPSLAESVSSGFPRNNFRTFHVKQHIKISQYWLQATSRRQPKIFRCSSFLKMLPRCGRAAHICGANCICSILAGKSRGGTPFCRMLKIGFSKNNSCFVSCETLLLGKPTESGSAESLRYLPACCSPVVALSELPMNVS